MSKIRSRLVKLISISIIASVIVAPLFLADSVRAMTRNGPDPAEFGAARYVLARSDNTGDQSYIEIPIYYEGSSNPGSVNLLVNEIVRGPSAINNQYISANGGGWFAGDTNVAVGGFQWNASMGLWRSVVSFRLMNDGQTNFYRNRIAFRLSLPNDNWLIGNATGGSSGFFNIIAANPSAGQNVGRDYSVQFATPCDITDNTSATIALYDLDSGQADNEGRWINVYITDVTSGGFVGISPSGASGQRETYYLTMTLQPNHKYILHINNVSPINLIQYKFPYDNATYATGCPAGPQYTLSPSIGVTPSVIEAGTTLNISPSISNTGPTNSASTQWEITKIIVPPGNTPVPNPTAGTSDVAPCGSYYVSAGTTCSTVKNGTSVFKVNGTVASGDGLSAYSTISDDVAAGTKICFALSVKPHSSDDAKWAHSSVACALVGKKPKTQIWGGDLISSKYVNSSASTKDISGMPRTFGSWVEYGIFAVRDITGAASGSAYAGVGLANAGKCNTSYLSFTNSGNRTCSPSTPIGNYANSSSIPDVAASFPTSASTPSIGPNDLLSQSSPSGVFKVDGGEISLRGGNIRKGRWVVINALQATVTITDDIKYTEGQLQSVSDIPQVIIIADKIIINSNVTRVDAWLVANGTNGIIETCNVNSSNYNLTGADRLTANKCNLPLTVNGPVMAKQLWLRRTGGSGGGLASGDPAEVFNLRPDAYMWANLHASGNNRVQTVYSTELPPRL